MTELLNGGHSIRVEGGPLAELLGGHSAKLAEAKLVQGGDGAEAELDIHDVGTEPGVHVHGAGTKLD